MPPLAIAHEAFTQLDEEVGEVTEDEVEQIVHMWDDIFTEV